jgi:hypothetical protein
MTLKRCFGLTLILALAGCATSLDPNHVRKEIAAQTGADPQGIFEFTLGPTMLTLARTRFTASGTAAEPGAQPLSGLRKLQFAVYTLDPARAPALDLTRMKISGWESTVRKRDANSSTLVLVRGAEGDTVGDVVLLTAGTKEAIFVRWTGRLSRKVPEQIGEAVASGGPDALKHDLLSLTEQLD